MAAYFLSDFAKRELDDIWDYYYENVSELEANRRVAYLTDQFDLLTEFPQMGRPRPEYALALGLLLSTLTWSGITSGLTN